MLHAEGRVYSLRLICVSGLMLVGILLYIYSTRMQSDVMRSPVPAFQSLRMRPILQFDSK
jgi:hypothetical protein